MAAKKSDPDDIPTAPSWIVGLVLLLAGAVVLGIGRLVGPDSRAPLFWGLLLVSLSLPPIRASWVRFRQAETVSLGGEIREGVSPIGVTLALLPLALSVGMLVTDPAPSTESIYAVAVAWTGWTTASIFWTTFRSRLPVLGSPDPARRMPGPVRFAWPIVPGAVLLAWSVTAPGSDTYGCDDGATCFEGPISWLMPGMLLLIVGVVFGVKQARGSSLDKTVRFRLPGLASKGVEQRLDRLAELGRLRQQGVIDRAEFDRLKAEVLGGGGGGAQS